LPSVSGSATQFVSCRSLVHGAQLTDRTLYRWCLLLDFVRSIDRHDGLQVLRQFDQGGSRILCWIKAECLGSQGTLNGCKLPRAWRSHQLTI
jgi:hypothetical protein